MFQIVLLEHVVPQAIISETQEENMCFVHFETLSMHYGLFNGQDEVPSASTMRWAKWNMSHFLAYSCFVILKASPFSSTLNGTLVERWLIRRSVSSNWFVTVELAKKRLMTDPRRVSAAFSTIAVSVGDTRDNARIQQSVKSVPKLFDRS